MKPEPRVTRANVPWLALILLLVSVFFFWVLPYLLGRREVKVEFEEPKTTQAQP